MLGREIQIHDKENCEREEKGTGEGELEGEWSDLSERKVKEIRVRIARVRRDPLRVNIEEDEDGDDCGGFTADIGGAFMRVGESLNTE